MVGCSGRLGARREHPRVPGARGRRPIAELRDVGPYLQAVRVAADVPLDDTFTRFDAERDYAASTMLHVPPRDPSNAQFRTPELRNEPRSTFTRVT